MFITEDFTVPLVVDGNVINVTLCGYQRIDRCNISVMCKCKDGSSLVAKADPLQLRFLIELYLNSYGLDDLWASDTPTVLELEERGNSIIIKIKY